MATVAPVVVVKPTAPAPPPPAAPAAPAEAPPPIREPSRMERAIAALETREKEIAEAAPPAEEPPAPAAPAAAAPASAVPPAPPAPAVDPAEKGLSKLAAREKELRAIEQANKAKEAEVDAKLAKADALEKARANALADPDAYLQAAGLSLEAVQNFYLNGKKPTVDLQTQAELKSVKQQLEDLRKGRETDTEAAKRAKDAQDFAAAKAEAEKAVAAKGTELELLAKAPHRANLVLFQVQKHYQETDGEVLPFEEAAKLAEAALEEELAPFLTTAKAKAKMLPPPATPPASSAQSGPSRAAPRTLTKSAVATPPTRPERPPTREERIRRAASRIKFTGE